MYIFILFSMLTTEAFFKEESKNFEDTFIVKQKAKLILAIKKKNNHFYKYFPEALPSTHNPSHHNLRDRQIVGFLANESFVFN